MTEIDLTTDLEPLCKLEDMLVRWLSTKAIPWVQDPSATRQRIYRGFENHEVAQSQADKSIPLPDGDTTLTEDEPSEGQESSLQVQPFIKVDASIGRGIDPDFCGNYEIDVSFFVESNQYDTTHRVHRSRVNDVLKLLLTDTLLSELKEFDPDWDTSKIVFRGIDKRGMGKIIDDLDFGEEHDRFLAYLRFNKQLPDSQPIKGATRQLNSPVEWRLLAMLMENYHLTFEQAMGTPVLRAHALWAARGDREGWLNLYPNDPLSELRIAELNEWARQEDAKFDKN